MKQAELLEEALKLGVRERAVMADRLLASLDELSPAELETLWADEAQRRDGAVTQRRLASAPAEQVLDGLKAMLG